MWSFTGFGACEVWKAHVQPYRGRMEMESFVQKLADDCKVLLKGSSRSKLRMQSVNLIDVQPARHPYRKRKRQPWSREYLSFRPNSMPWYCWAHYTVGHSHNLHLFRSMQTQLVHFLWNLYRERALVVPGAPARISLKVRGMSSCRQAMYTEAAHMDSLDRPRTPITSVACPTPSLLHVIPSPLTLSCLTEAQV